jgi:hypothetical protein
MENNIKTISDFNTKFWLQFSVINLLIVALLGTLMRYKIGFVFPFFNQKYLQESHSHFAFIGWISHTLYTLITHFIKSKITDGYFKNYRLLLIANLICAYGMLLSFMFQGYSVLSIILSSGTIIIACFFAYFFIKDLNQLTEKHPSIPWFKAALWFNILSSIGTFYLVQMLATRNFDEHWYLASIYFFLHFQYNGFFIFTCMGLVYSQIQTVLPTFKPDNLIFKLFFISFIPAYFLSVLWAKIPVWLYGIVVIAAFMQLYAWIKFLIQVKNSLASKTNLTKFSEYLFLFVAAAFSIKLLLQLGSTIPVVSNLAFGFRPIVIAYLHLVLLAVISVFLMAYTYSFQLINTTKLTMIGLTLFAIGVFLNELVLAVQGIASFSYIPIPMVNETLFFVSLLLILALTLLTLSNYKKANN